MATETDRKTETLGVPQTGGKTVMDRGRAAFKCHICPVCNGHACGGQLPGMGGVFDGANNIANCAAWKRIYSSLTAEQIDRANSILEGVVSQKGFEGASIQESLQKPKGIEGAPIFRLAPMTGAEENIGWPDEESFYKPFFEYVASLQNVLGIQGTRVALSIGDGCPDEKLLAGIEAMRGLQNVSQGQEAFRAASNNCGLEYSNVSQGQKAFRAGAPISFGLSKPRAAVFLKPYPQEKLFQRMEWAADVAEYFGVDIDAYNIVTMRNKVHLEKKTAAQLKELRGRAKVPFVVKGIFTRDDIELIKELKPEVAIVSNHGGRVETARASSAEFLQENIHELKKYSGEVWVDGGIRDKQDALTALALGADQILLGRPLVRGFLGAVASSIAT